MTTAAPAPAPQPVTTTTATASGPGGRDLGTFLITCYALTGTTANGSQAGPDSAAVDPSVIPLGSHIWIAGVGDRVADDTGGAIRGDHIDIWESSVATCENFGRQYHDVHLL